MSHRAKHRYAAFSRRLERTSEGLPADPSNRTRAPRRPFRCPCGSEFREMWQILLHLNMRGDHSSVTTNSVVEVA